MLFEDMEPKFSEEGSDEQTTFVERDRRSLAYTGPEKDSTRASSGRRRYVIESLAFNAHDRQMGNGVQLSDYCCVMWPEWW